MSTVKSDDVEDLWGYAKRLRFIRETISESFKERSAADIKVLDVGCGNGSQLAIPLVRDGFQLTGIDPHEVSILRARQLATGASNARFLCGAVEELPSAENFDVVILSEVLEHLHDPVQLLAQSLVHLKQDGVVIITVPNGYGEFELDWWIFRSLRLPWLVSMISKKDKQEVGSTDNLESGHVQFFTRSRLRQLFANCRLVITRESSGSLLGGPFIAYSLARSSRFIEWNARITDSLPLGWASSWYFALRREAETSNLSGK